MATQKELEMGRLAVENQILTQEALDECLVYQSETGRPLSFVLIERGFLDDREIGLLVDLSERRREEPGQSSLARHEVEDVLFANLAVTEGHVRLAELQACLADRDETVAGGQRITLGQMLVKRKVLPVQTFLELTRKVEDQAFECYQCHSQQRPSEIQAGNSFACRDCGAELRVPGMGELLEHLAQFESSASGSSDATRVEPRRIVQGAIVDAGGLHPGDVFSGYRIVAEIARGGMGIVFRAEQINLGRPVALKIIRTDGGARDVRIQRFKREAQAIGRLRHPGIVQIFDVGESGGAHYIAMEYLEGRGLDKMIEEEDLRPADATRIVRDLALAVAYAHSQGVLHRDLKPSNVIVDAAGRTRLTDFGLAKLAGKETGMELTGSGDIIGTPFYIPPELIERGSRSISEAGDVYALGVIYYQLLTRRLPFNGTTSVEVYHRILSHTPAAPSRVFSQVRRSMDAVCLRAMARDPAERYATAAELAGDLDRILSGQPVEGGTVKIRKRSSRKIERDRRRPLLLWLAAGAVVAALGIGAWWYSARSTGEPAAPPPDPAPSPVERPPEEPSEAERLAQFFDARERARRATEEERWDDAILWNEKAVALFPDRPESHDAALQLFAVYLRRQDHVRARESAEKALRVPGIAPEKRSKALVNLGVALWQLGEKEKALALTEDAVRITPDDFYCLRNRASFLIGLGREFEAIPIFVRLRELKPDDPEVVAALAEWERAYLQAIEEARQACDAGQWDRTIEMARKALAYFPDRLESFDAKSRLGVALYQKQDFPGSRLAFEQCLAYPGVAPPSLAWAKGNLAVVLWYQGEQARALALTEEALAVIPEDWDLLLHKAQFLHSLGRLAEAREVFEHLERIRPDDPTVRAFLDELRK